VVSDANTHNWAMEMDGDQQPQRDSRRTGGEVTGPAPVQIALALLVFFLGLLVLWVLWPLISG
jgi:hypothetical protein